MAAGVTKGAAAGSSNGAGGAAGGGDEAVATPSIKPKNIAHELSPDQYLFRPDPRLPDAVNAQRQGTGEASFAAVLCVDTGGHVTRVRVLEDIPGAGDSIATVLRTWRVKPQPIPICYPVRLLFTVD